MWEVMQICLKFNYCEIDVKKSGKILNTLKFYNTILRL